VQPYRFTVDAELLRELGERLVGQPHIALAELIKNSYDADATKVVVEFDGTMISIVDNGHGMSESDFADRWMRIGTTRKRSESHSPELGRLVTGSKGVGRLAAQLLSRKLVLESVARVDPSMESGGPTLSPGIRATVDWDRATQAGELTSVVVPVEELPTSVRFADGSSSGTRVTLETLTGDWDEENFGRLAQEIWALQPPFQLEDSRRFEVELKSPFPDVVAKFSRQMNAIFSIWNARITGGLVPAGQAPPTAVTWSLPARFPEDTDQDGDDPDLPAGPYELSEAAKERQRLPSRYFTATIEFREGTSRTVVWEVEHSDVDELEFEIRVFDLQRRQPEGIRVSDAREYLRRFGGVGVFDNGFRLPYYGAQQDWLNIGRDQGARLGASRLLPKELGVANGLQDLPANSRLFGWVAVSTNHEEDNRKQLGIERLPGLSVQVTRDRLTSNAAYHRLRVMIRAAVDLYAMEKARAKLQLARPIDSSESPQFKPPSTYMEKVAQTLSASRSEMPAHVFSELKTVVDDASAQAKRSEDAAQAYSALLGALATAGMTSLAYEHEMSKQVNAIHTLSRQLERLLPEMTPELASRAASTVGALSDWVRRVRSIRQVFAPLLSKETRETVERYRARGTIESVVSQIRGLAKGVAPDIDGVPADLRLPRATYPAWSSVFQNVLINAYNALHDNPEPRVVIDGGGDDRDGWIRVSDNGAGVDLDTAAELWNPFARKLVLPPEIEAAGLGGMGLGLTIVRMITDDIGVHPKFVTPPAGMSTALRLQWKGQK